MKINSLKEAPYIKTWRYEGNDPIDAGWALQHYVERNWRRPGSNTEWRPNEPFAAKLLFQGPQRGRSAAYFNWHDPETNTRYPMLMSGMSDLLTRSVVDYGVTFGTWIVVKRGQNYGIELYGGD